MVGTRLTLILIVVLVIPDLLRAQTPLGTGFTFQGRVKQAGQLVSDSCDFEFTLWDAATLGGQVGPTLTFDAGSALPVNQGLFSATLDFGAAALNGDERWLEVAVGCPSGEALIPVSPRQELTAAPYAAYSLSGKPPSSLDAPDGDPTDVVVVDADGNVGIAGTLQITGLSAGAEFEVFAVQDAELVGNFANISLGNSAVVRVFVSADSAVARLHAYGSNFSDPVRRNRSTLEASRPTIPLGEGPSSLDLVASELDGEIRFFSGGYDVATQRMVISESGNVGIGTTTPDGNHALDVQKSRGIVSGRGRPTTPDGTDDRMGYFLRRRDLDEIADNGIWMNSNVSGSEYWENVIIGASGGGGNIVFMTGSTLQERMRVDTSGHVGIGTVDLSDATVTIRQGQAGEYQLFLAQNNQALGNGFLLRSDMADGALTFASIQGGAVSERVKIESNGVVSGTFGIYHAASDIRLKRDISDIPNALQRVLALRGINFKWKDPHLDGDKPQMGLIAQEVEKIFPEVVHTAEDKMGTKAVEYEHLVAALIEALKEMHESSEEKNVRFAELTKRVERLETLLNSSIAAQTEAR